MEKFYQIKISGLTEHDLEDILNHISFQLQMPQAAHKLMTGLLKEMRKLSYHPYRHSVEASDWRYESMGARKLNYKNYKIYYCVEEEKLQVNAVRILHALEGSKRLH